VRIGYPRRKDQILQLLTLPLLCVPPAQSPGHLEWTAASCEAETKPAWLQVFLAPPPAMEQWLTLTSPYLCLRRRRRWEIQPDHFSGKGCLRDEQDPIRPPSDYNPAQYWNPRECHYDHRRHFCVTARTKYTAKGNSEVECHITGLFRSLQL